MDEDAFGGRRVTVAVGVLLLQEETAQQIIVLEQGSDYRLDGDRSSDRDRRSVALYPRDA